MSILNKGFKTLNKDNYVIKEDLNCNANDDSLINVLNLVRIHKVDVNLNASNTN